ncbi:uncharacterized protein LOC129287958 isoform X3 [Prosopis cineraria]|uniref:uncharacterized protein LOC129287958 isoform X3 n=1 Tax=Prosopis cineraria TaxID=364024 RepID=UPI00240F86DF|nr:uncharacterized protein LOC129287958 isoform X3 [Prosopis cineraria]
MKEIVTKDEDASNRCNFVFKFPKLTTLSLQLLPELRGFYQETHAVELQALTSLYLRGCYKLEVLTPYSEVKPILSAFVKVLSNLKVLAVGPKEMKWLQDSIGNNVYQMRNIKQLILDGLSSIDILFWFLYRTPNLEILYLWNSAIKEMMENEKNVSVQKIGTVVQLKQLRLSISYLPQNMGLENNPILPRVERLYIEKCHHLINLLPSSISFTHLSHIDVRYCFKLKNLMSSSTAKSLVQLTIVEVAQCAMMEEIVTVGDNEEDKEDEIVFGKLKILKLVDLRNLTSFCNNSKNKLVFRLPALERLIVTGCWKLDKFYEKIIITPKLEKVNIVEGEGREIWYWEGDLNATIQKIFIDKVHFEHAKQFELSCHSELQELWQGKVSPPDSYFNNLKSLTANNCFFLSEVFPSRLLSYFKNLEELQVHFSPVKVIFDIDDKKLTEINRQSFKLKRVNLHGLPNLKCVWSKDPRRFISFLNLQEIIVTSCVDIKTLFPASLAGSLLKLKTLEVSRCNAMEEIFGREEAEAEAKADEARRKFEFHNLASLILYNLPRLECFYPGRYTLDCPNINRLHVHDCNKLDTFASDFQSHQGAVGYEDEASISIRRQPLFSFRKVIPNLENLTLTVRDMTMFSLENFPDNLFFKLKYLELYFGDSFEGGATLPFGLLQKVPHMKSLSIRNFNALNELFPTQRPEDIDYIISALAQYHVII